MGTKISKSSERSGRSEIDVAIKQLENDSPESNEIWNNLETLLESPQLFSLKQLGLLISLTESSLLEIMPYQTIYEEHSGEILRREHLIWDKLCASVPLENRSDVFKCLLKRYYTLPGLRCLSTWLSNNQSFAQSISKAENRIAARLVHITTKSTEEIRSPNLKWGVFWFFTTRLMNLTSCAGFCEQQSYLQMMFPMWNVWSQLEKSRSSGTDVRETTPLAATKQESKVASFMRPTTSSESIPSNKMEL